MRRQKAWLMILIGLCGKAATAPFLFSDVRHPVLVVLASVVTIATGVVFVVGCTYYARTKGWRWWVGLLGVFSLIGLLVLWELDELPQPRTRIRQPNPRVQSGAAISDDGGEQGHA